MKLAINGLPDEFGLAADFCRSEGLGLEVTAFAFPQVLDGKVEAELARHLPALAGISPISFHGPFLDLYAASPDPEIVRVARQRHEQGLTAAEKLGATIYVAHLNFLPLIRNPGFPARFVQGAASFWRPLAERAGRSGMVIALENMWEPDPSIQLQVVRATGHASLKASFDNGHALVFSDLPATAWMDTLGEHLVHCHLHDNDRRSDLHQPVTLGKENWPDLLAAYRNNGSRALLVLESDTLQANRTSLAHFRNLIETQESREEKP